MVRRRCKRTLGRQTERLLPFLDLPRHTDQPLELALDLPPQDEQRFMLEGRGWRVVDSAGAATSWDYQRYIQDSFGEFSCAKPACLKLENAWVSNRTLCYLASGKPAVVQHTGQVDFCRIPPACFGSAI